MEVLEHAGYRVEVPEAAFCWGRPLYDYGMLGKAREWLQQTLAALGADIRAATPVVVLEPSCASVFDELLNLYPDDPTARRLSGLVVTFGATMRCRPGSASGCCCRRCAEPMRLR